MKPFKYTPAASTNAALQSLKDNASARLLAGGTNLVDLMKEDVEQPNELIDISGLVDARLTTIQRIPTGPFAGGVRIGALAKNTSTANHPIIRQQFPLLSQSILAGASEQIRNMATNGGNLLQRTRCPYFYDKAMPCNKREPETGCGALEGVNRMHAIYGWSPQCVAVHPSDMCVALAALDAVVIVKSASTQERRIPFHEFHRLPGDLPQKDNTLEAGEMILAIEIPANQLAGSSYYLKIRDRASYAFALVSVAAGLHTNGSTIKAARIALGGVAHKPWRATAAEDFLAGKSATEVNFKSAAAIALRDAKPLHHNQFKVPVCEKAITHALSKAMGIQQD